MAEIANATGNGQMKTRRLGDSGLKVSEVGLGCNNFGWRIGEPEAQAVVDAALDAGVTLFDTADMYGGTQSEVMLGRALGKRRSHVVIATKFGIQVGDDPSRKGASRRWIMRAVEDSLTRLGTDYIDLYQLHRPDPDTGVEETLRALDDLVSQGKVRYIGASNMPAWRIADADWVARAAGRTRFVSVQNEFSLLKREAEAEVLPACMRFGVGFLPYFPLASGALTGKYRRGEPLPEHSRIADLDPGGARFLGERTFDAVEKLQAWAAARGRSVLELAFAWLLGHPIVSSVIAGATSAEQVRANAATAGWRLSPEEVAEVRALVS
jgi:aryl-alcohol dehydrogenase-like predicted oxidoreductase